MNAFAAPDEIGGDRAGLHGHRHQLGLEADLDHQIGRHQIHRVPVAAADEVEAGGQGPEHPAALAVVLVVNRGAAPRVPASRVPASGVPTPRVGGHPRMLPGVLLVVVVVVGKRPSIDWIRMSARE